MTEIKIVLAPVSDLAAAKAVYTALLGQGTQHDADIVQEPTDQPYGVRDCAVRDPAGNLIRIQQLT